MTNTDKDLLNRDPITEEPGAHPIGTGVGAASGALAGAAIGALTAGPVGIIAGSMIGGIAGGMAGKEVAEANNPTLGGDREENLVGEGVGASAGIMTGAAIGSTVGPIGTVVGAGIGAIAGGYAGNKIEEAIDNSDNNDDDEPPFGEDRLIIHEDRMVVEDPLLNDRHNKANDKIIDRIKKSDQKNKIDESIILRN